MSRIRFFDQPTAQGVHFSDVSGGREGGKTHDPDGHTELAQDSGELNGYGIGARVFNLRHFEGLHGLGCLGRKSCDHRRSLPLAFGHFDIPTELPPPE